MIGFTLLGSLLAASLVVSRAETPAVTPVTSKLFIAPSSSRMAGGTAKLTVGSLRRRGSTYVGEYRIKVLPYFFKNEKGKLFIEVTEKALRHMLGGGITRFAGRATTNSSGLTRRIMAKATPSGGNGGALTFTVFTENGPLVFNTSYRVDPP